MYDHHDNCAAGLGPAWMVLPYAARALPTRLSEPIRHEKTILEGCFMFAPSPTQPHR